MSSEARARRWFRRPRLWIAVAALVVVVRVVLPYIVRWQIESQANQAVVGHIAVGDVDLSLLRGGIALKDVALHGATAAPTDPPIVAWKRLWVNISWLGLVRKTIRIEDVALDGLALNLDRLANGDLVLPKPASASPPPVVEVPLEAAKKASTLWRVVLDRALLTDGSLRFTDHVATPPEVRRLALPELAVTEVRLQPSPENRPGRVNLRAHLADGKIGLKTLVVPGDAGFDVRAYLRLVHVPLDRANVHVPSLGWSDLRGRVGAELSARLRPGAGPVVRGWLELHELAIAVPGRERPDLAWRKLVVVLDRLDLGHRVARVERVGLEGAQVVVEPRASPPLAIIPHSAGAESKPAAPPEPAPAEPAGPWQWRVGTVDLKDAHVTLVLEPPPLEVDVVHATVEGLASEPGTTAKVGVDLRLGEGALGLDGTVGLQPVAAHVHVRPQRLALGPLLAASGGAPVVLPKGVLDGDVEVHAEEEPLTLSGTLGIADLAVGLPQGEDFGVGWKQLDLGIRAIQIPGVLPGHDGAAKGPLSVALERLHLDAPVVTLTRTPEGLVLPGAKPAAAEPAAAAPTSLADPAPPAEAKSPSAKPESNAAFVLALDDLDLEKGDVTVVDRTSKPFFRGQLTALALKARNVHVPENTFDTISLSLKAPGGAPLAVDAKRDRRGVVQVTSNVERLKLAQFNPYVTPSGYSVGRGTLTLHSKVNMAPDKYDAQNRIELDGLTVAGGQGESLFKQNFGVSLTVALALMRDLKGQIAFGVPIQGDRERGMRIDLMSVVREALARAIIGAIASPLKLLGAVALSGNKVESFEPEPIAFIPGQTVVAADGRPKVDKLASALSQLPAFHVDIHGVAGPADARALSEAAVLIDLKEDRGVLGTLRDLPTRRARGRIRTALEARARGESGELDADDQKRLDAWVAEKPVG